MAGLKKNGYKGIAITLIIIVCLILVPLTAMADSAAPAIPAVPAKRIIILNSYHQGMFWTDEEMKGLLNVLNRKYESDSISIEYMDCKNYPDNTNLEYLKSYFSYKYSKEKINLIIATDDAALEFALARRSEIFSDAPVVFCGVNEDGAARILKGQKGATGVIEEVDTQDTVKAAYKMNPHIKRIYLVYDNTESGLSTGELCIRAIHKMKPATQVVPLSNKSVEDILKELENAPGDSAVITTAYTIDKKGNAVDFMNLCRKMSQNSSVPLYSLYEASIRNGAIGGSMLSGELQGRKAAELGLKILKGVDVNSIPIARTASPQLIFDYKQLSRFHIGIDSIPKGSKIVNQPFSFFKTYKRLVFTAIIIFLLLIVLIIVLLLHLRKVRAIKEDLIENHKELTLLYDDLIAADTKLKEQYAELLNMQKNLALSEHSYSLLFEKMLNGFFIFEPVYDGENMLSDFRFISVNPGFYKQIGQWGGDVIGKTWREAFGYPNLDLAIYQKVLETGEVERFESYYPIVDAYYMVNTFMISENKVGVIFDNITDYKTAIKEAKRLNNELEQRVAERTAELQSAVNELEAFTYTASHDLKSPLRAIDGYSKILLEDFGVQLGGDASGMLNNIGIISREMIDMINKLLQYSTTSRAVINREECDVAQKIQSVFNELRSIYPQRDISLVIETGLPIIQVDKVLFRQLLQNIISNAIKFTKNREKAVITVGCTITQKEYVFYVRDNGVGFDMEYSGKLFSIFQRMHTSEEFEGSGIGLVTVKKIIEKHGGRAWIEAQEGAGAVVYFTLPFGRS